MTEKPKEDLAEARRASSDSDENSSGSVSAATASFGRRAFLGRVGLSTVAAATNPGGSDRG